LTRMDGLGSWSTRPYRRIQNGSTAHNHATYGMGMGQDSDRPIPECIVQAAAAAVFGMSHPNATMLVHDVVARANGVVAKGRLAAGDNGCMVVVKWVGAGYHELDAYRALGPAGAPIAALHASAVLEDGRELLVLEQLKEATALLDGFAGFPIYIDTLARLNATRAPLLRIPEPSWALNYLPPLRSAWQLAMSGSWGNPMAAAAAVLDSAWSQLEVMAHLIQAELDQLQLDPAHQDPQVSNCGWRGRELRFFDLSSASLMPAFADLGLVLGGISQSWPDSKGRTPWIERYLDAYGERTGRTISVDAARRAIDLHLAAAALWYDEVALSRTRHRFATDPSAAASALGWYELKWNRLRQLADRGIGAIG
jgi:hypothetical protein